jgi:hypothetical protein
MMTRLFSLSELNHPCLRSIHLYQRVENLTHDNVSNPGLGSRG